MEAKEEIRRVVKQYSPGLVRLALTYLRNVHDAEDVAQDVFLTYVRGAPRFEGEEHEKAWLIRVTINRCKNLMKQRRFWSRKPLPEDLPYLAAEEGDLIRQVTALDEKYRLPLHLHYYEGYTIKEIAQLLNEKPATVGTRLARARERIKTQIGGIMDA